ncbi:MAG: hypothetical protein WAO52_02950 [Prolixibacteraceae bacterium]
MKKTYFTLLIFLSASAFSQEFSIGLRAGMGMYSMSELDQFQNYRADQVPFPLEITESYPITPFYRGEVALNNMKFIDKIALFYGFYSTGARSTLSDYSGRIDMDAVINGNQFGLNIQKDFYKQGVLSAGVYAEGGYLFSKLKTKDNLEIVFPEEISEVQENSLVANGFTGEPGIQVCYHLKPLILQLSLGYLIDFSKDLHLKGNKDMILGVYNHPVSPQWSGLRFSLQASFLFRKKGTAIAPETNSD